MPDRRTWHEREAIEKAFAGKKFLRAGSQSGRFPGWIVAAAHPDRESVMLGEVCGICGMIWGTSRDITNLTGWRSMPFGLPQLLLG